MIGCAILDLMEPRNQASDFVAYSFSGTEQLSLNFKYNESKKKHEYLAEVKYPILEKSSVIGSPIIVEEKKKKRVVGVVGVSKTGELCPCFITKEDLGGNATTMGGNVPSTSTFIPDDTPGKQGPVFEEGSKPEGHKLRNGENFNEENKNAGYKASVKAGTGDDICTRHSNNNMQIPRGNCYSCAKENSMKDKDAHSVETKLIDSYLKKCGKIRKPVPGDGHCIIHAFARGLNEIDQQDVSSADSLLPQIREEFLKNIQLYEDRVNHLEVDPIKELEIYIESKDYTLSIVDLMPQLLANMKETTIVIYQVSEGTVSPLPISPFIATAKEVNLSKIGQHYDAILKRDTGDLSSRAHKSSPMEGGNDSDHLKEDVQSSKTDVTNSAGGNANAMGGKVPSTGTFTPHDTPVTSRQPEDGARSSNTNPGPIVTGALSERDGPGATVYKSGAVSKEILPDLAFDVQRQRRKLCRALELEDADWCSIETDNENDVYEQTIKMLFRWLEFKARDATYAVLGEALKEVDLDIFCDGYCLVKHSSPRPPLNIPGNLKMGRVGQDDRRKIVKAVEGKWKRLGRSLGIEEGTLDNIKDANRNDISEQSYQMIVHWQQIKGSEATYEELAKALLHRTVGMSAVVGQLLCQERD